MTTDETRKAQEVWRAAQQRMLAASNKLFGLLGPEEKHTAREAYKDSVAEVEAAKAYFDECRAKVSKATVKPLSKTG